MGYYNVEHPDYYDNSGYIREKMDDHKSKLIGALLQIVPKNYVVSFAGIISDGYINGNRDAENVLKSLWLDEKHAYAWLDDEDSFERAVIEENQNMYLEV